MSDVPMKAVISECRSKESINTNVVTVRVRPDFVIHVHFVWSLLEIRLVSIFAILKWNHVQSIKFVRFC